jgi:hypothetical protein
MPGPIFPIILPGPGPGVASAITATEGMESLFALAITNYVTDWNNCWRNAAGDTPQQFYSAFDQAGKPPQSGAMYGLACQFYPVIAPFYPQLANMPPCPAGWTITTVNGVATPVQGPATSYGEVVPSSATSGTPISLLFQAFDAAGFQCPGYTGTANVTCSDAAATFPATVTFANGVANFQVTFNTSGPQTVTITDKDNVALTATINVQVN